MSQNTPSPFPIETQVKVATAGFTVGLTENLRASNEGKPLTPEQHERVKKASAIYSQRTASALNRFSHAADGIRSYCADLMKQPAKA